MPKPFPVMTERPRITLGASNITMPVAFPVTSPLSIQSVSVFGRYATPTVVVRNASGDGNRGSCVTCASEVNRNPVLIVRGYDMIDNAVSGRVCHHLETDTNTLVV